MKRDHESDANSGTPITWEESYEGQLRKLVGNRQLIIPATRSVVMDGEGRILLIRRKDWDEWGFPAGALELGESVLDCCKREVKEETGLDVMAAVPIAIYSEPRFRYADHYGNQRQMLTIVLLVREWSGQISARSDETTDCRFFEMDSLPDLPPIYAETVEDVSNFRGALILK
jgi:ADP-ribose pyrophosphatase YjhB (NUDIX family)